MLAGLGVLFIFGGEAFCILGPIRYQRLVHVTCHAVLYTGMVFAGLGAVLHWAGRRGKLRPPSEQRP